jgi:hypothetical protein
VTPERTASCPQVVQAADASDGDGDGAGGGADDEGLGTTEPELGGNVDGEDVVVL